MARTPNGVNPVGEAAGVAPLGLGRTNGSAGRAGEGARDGPAPPTGRGGAPAGAGCASTRPNSAAAVVAPRFGAGDSCAGGLDGAAATGGGSWRAGGGGDAGGADAIGGAAGAGTPAAGALVTKGAGRGVAPGAKAGGGAEAGGA